jgi:type III pantothenate kinase
MLLAIDIGNTQIVIGVYRDDELAVDWRLMTDQRRTGDEYGILLQNLFAGAGLSCQDINGIIVSCVVPPMLSMMLELCKRYFHAEPLCIGPYMDMGIKICYENPKEVGADRLVNAVAAFEKYRRSVIVIDFGTATTFDYIAEKGEYIGGAIAPGIVISSEALFQRASKLPRVDFAVPQTAIPRNTVESMQAGIIFGYVGLVEGLVRRMKNEVATKPLVVATGGLATRIAQHTGEIDEVDDYLTLQGLKIIYDRCA